MAIHELIQAEKLVEVSGLNALECVNVGQIALKNSANYDANQEKMLEEEYDLIEDRLLGRGKVLKIDGETGAVDYEDMLFDALFDVFLIREIRKTEGFVNTQIQGMDAVDVIEKLAEEKKVDVSVVFDEVSKKVDYSMIRAMFDYCNEGVMQSEKHLHVQELSQVVVFEPTETDTDESTAAPQSQLSEEAEEYLNRFRDLLKQQSGTNEEIDLSIDLSGVPIGVLDEMIQVLNGEILQRENNVVGVKHSGQWRKAVAQQTGSHIKFRTQIMKQSEEIKEARA